MRSSAVRNRSWFVLTVCLSALFGATASAQNNNNNNRNVDPPGTQTHMAEFRAWFKTYANKDDNMIGKEEAAKAFGYSRAYDAPPPPPKGAKPKDKDEEKPKEEKEVVGSTSTAKTGDKVGPSTSDASKYASRLDYQFIKQLDKDNDEKVSQDEFEAWAHDYIVAQLKLIQAEQKALANAMKKGGTLPPPRQPNLGAAFAKKK
jgi:hypothetical protein